MHNLKSDWKIIEMVVGFLNRNKDLFGMLALCACSFMSIITIYFIDLRSYSDSWHPILGDSLTGSITSVILCYFSLYFCGIFFNAALVACITLRLDGRRGTLLDGIRLAVRAIPSLLPWTLYSATIGLLLNGLAAILDDSDHIVFKLLSGLITLIKDVILTAAQLLIPILVMQRCSIKHALQQIRQQKAKTYSFIGVGFSLYLLSMALFCLIYLMTELIRPYDSVLATHLAFVAFGVLAVFNVSFGTMISAAVRSIYYLEVIEGKDIPLWSPFKYR